jgi:hypothetical protein
LKSFILETVIKSDRIAIVVISSSLSLLVGLDLAVFGW